MSQSILSHIEMQGTTMYDDVLYCDSVIQETHMSTSYCNGCKTDLPINLFSKDKSRACGVRYKCKACSAIEFAKFKNSDGYVKRLVKANQQRIDLKQNNPIKRWAHVAFHNAKKRAGQTNAEFTITKDWLMDNAVQYCPLLDVELIYNASKSTPNTASVDRKDPARGYTPDNCKVISFKANRIKSNASNEEIALLAQRLTKY
jgi:hypothetical protein